MLSECVDTRLLLSLHPTCLHHTIDGNKLILLHCTVRIFTMFKVSPSLWLYTRWATLPSHFISLYSILFSPHISNCAVTILSMPQLFPQKSHYWLDRSGLCVRSTGFQSEIPHRGNVLNDLSYWVRAQIWTLGAISGPPTRIHTQGTQTLENKALSWMEDMNGTGYQ